jgi:archaellum biogenesis protein FlaJ (TadC family)
MLTQQPKDQLQSEHEWKNQRYTKYKDEAIYNIWIMMMVIRIIIITKIKVLLLHYDAVDFFTAEGSSYVGYSLLTTI